MDIIKRLIEEILAIKDPNEAYLRLALKTYEEDLSLDKWEEIVELYMEKYSVTHDDMAFTPNGEKVIKPEMFLW